MRGWWLLSLQGTGLRSRWFLVRVLVADTRLKSVGRRRDASSYTIGGFVEPPPPTDVIKEHALNLEDIISYILLTLGWHGSVLVGTVA